MRTDQDFTGALIEVDPSDGYITNAYICAGSDQDAAIIQGALARITDSRQWGWLSRLLLKKNKSYRLHKPRRAKAYR